MELTVTVAAAAYPVLLADVKKHLQIAHTGEDTPLQLLIHAATDLCEAYCNRAFINRTVTLELDLREAFSPITLPLAPLSSLTSFEYYTSDGTKTTVDSGTYYLTGVNPARIVANASGWLMEREYKSHLITYVAGYGTVGATHVPDAINQAVRVTVADMWNNDESIDRSTGGFQELPASARNLLAPYRLLL